MFFSRASSLLPLALIACVFLAGCSLVTVPYEVTMGTVKGTLWATKTTYRLATGATKVVYRVGEFTYDVVKAPIDWALTSDEIETIDGLPPKEAIRQGRVKSAPYKVNGRIYYPMSVGESKKFEETGMASWYGYETGDRNSGRMTANGEIFDATGLTAAHQRLPLPTYVRVTNLENGASVIVRVNDRGPFPAGNHSVGRIIDLSRGAAQKLGFEKKGTAKVQIETVSVEER